MFRHREHGAGRAVAIRRDGRCVRRQYGSAHGGQRLADATRAGVVLFFARDRGRAMEMAALSSKTTHAAPQAIDACRVYAGLIVGALDGKPKRDLRPTTTRRDEVRGSGYVVESMEAALWAFHNHDDFRSGCLAAANLGDDADTTAAIYGQLAGAFYGGEGIPESWRKRITMAEEIREMADGLFALRE